MLRRSLDLLFALFWLVLLAPLMLIIAGWIWIDSGRPIFYTPMMIGWRQRPFRLFRYRTIKQGVDQPDSRLTRAGRLIRNISLDHLPMLVNLLNGDLTIVGPRPIEVGRVDANDAIWKQYFSVKPGLVNFAVLKMGKSWAPTYAVDPLVNRDLELSYLRTRSSTSDVNLFLRTLSGLIKSKGNIKARGEDHSDHRP